MKRHIAALVKAVVLFTLVSSSLFAAAPKWPHEGSDLKPDPAITWGNLPNGLRYAFMHHQEPGEGDRPNRRVSLRLHVNVGSLMEEESERGLAHFLEHMAFNGTQHFPAGEMVKYFQRLGMSFGAHTNAHTKFQETVYKLELPENTDAYLDDALKLLRDYADGMLLDPKEIGNERGVILSEKLARDTVQLRTLVESWKFFLPESLLPSRLPIGVEDVIRKATRERFVSFYQKWYTPDRLTLVIVGPLTPSKIIAKLETRFGDMKAPDRAILDPDLGRLSTGGGLRAKLHTEPEAGQTSVSIFVLRPSSRRPHTTHTKHEKLVRVLADHMLNRRFSELTAGKEPPFLSATSDNGDILDSIAEDSRFVETDHLVIGCKSDGWEMALRAGEQELRRALKFGFSETEFREVKARFLAFWDDAAETASSSRSKDLADGIVEHLAQRRVYTSPGDDLAWGKAALEKISSEQCADALRKSWSSEDVCLFVSGRLALEDSEQRIKDVFLKSRQVAVEPRAMGKQFAWAYTSFGPEAGRVANREEVKDLGLTLVTFANNVRLNLKPTKFEKDTIRVQVNFGAGRLTAPKDKPGLIDFAQLAFISGGLEKHSLEEFNRFAAGKKMETRFEMDDEFFTLSGLTNRKDLALQFQLLAAYLTAPGFREDKAQLLAQQIDSLYDQLEHIPVGIVRLKNQGILYNGDLRVASPQRHELKARTMADLKQWLTEPLQSSWLEIGVVGDFDPEAVIEAVAATFGALPARASARPDYTQERLISLAEPQDKLIHFTSRIPKAAVVVNWPTTDRRQDILLDRQCDVLAAVLADRVREKVREELGEVYTPDVVSAMSDTFTKKGVVVCAFVCEAKHAEKLGQIVRQLAGELAAKGATADELDRAKKPLLKRAEQVRHENAWWSFYVAGAQSYPQRLEWARTQARDFESVSLADVNRLAKTYLPPDRSILVRIVPEDAPEAPKKGTATEPTKRASKAK